MIGLMNEFTSWLKGKLQAQGMSGSELARRAHVSSGLVSMVLTEAQAPSYEFCAKISKPLGTSPIEVMRQAGLLAVGNETPTVRELIALLSEMSAEEQREILEFALFRREKRRGGQGKPTVTVTTE